jgi:hypothetical protein
MGASNGAMFELGLPRSTCNHPALSLRPLSKSIIG